jgi:hypothetical protein
MILNMIGVDGESETTIRLKLWPIISLIVAGIVGLALYVSNHESRICVTEKATQTVVQDVSLLNTKLDKIARDQDLYYSLREPKWAQWKAWNEKKRNGGDQ